MDNKFRKREWFAAITIIVLLLCFAFYAAWVNAGNKNALSYISFASTIVSIILALLAIGYTYGESILQKTSSDSIKSQISVLTELISKISEQTSAMDSITNISKSLTTLSDTMHSKIDTTNIKIDSTNDALNSFMDVYQSENITTKIESSNINNKVFENLINDGTYINAVALAMILLLNERTFNEGTNDIINEVRNVLNTTSSNFLKDDNLVILASGSYMTLYSLLSISDIVKLNKEIISFDSDFYSSVKNHLLLSSEKMSDNVFSIVLKSLIQRIK